MYYYTIPAIGTGTKDDPIRPAIPSGNSFVGSYDSKTNTFLIAVNLGLSPSLIGLYEITEAEMANIANQRGLLVSDINKWSVG